MKIKGLIYGLVFSLILFLSIGVIGKGDAWADWNIECVDCPKKIKYSSSRSIAIDSFNRPRIAYGGDHLYYAYYDGTQWQYETADTSSGVGNNVSIALDSNDKVHISYWDSINYDLKYATNASGSWVTTTVDSVGDVGQHNSIAIDSNNNVHISYYDKTNWDLKYATNASGSWIATTVDSSLYAGSDDNSIAIDSNDKVHISYFDTYNDSLKYVTNAGGSWVSTTIDSSIGSYLGSYTSIAVDSNNSIHISYSKAYDVGYELYDIKYATNVSGSWVVTTLAASIEYTNGNNSIAIDSNNNAHISYSSYSSLKYVTNAGGSWVTTTLTGSYDCYAASIAVDSNNKVHINSYYFNYTVDLRYTNNVSGSWVTTTVDFGRTAGMSNSIAIDSYNKMHIIYRDITNATGYDLKYANNLSGSWVTTTVDSLGMDTSIAIDSLNDVHISYFDTTNNDLKYATNASGSWVTSTIASTGNVGQYTSIAVDSNDKVHISYYDSTNKDLKYATNASGSWVSTTIDSSGDAGLYTSIAVDSLNNVHISYYDGYPNYNLKYATNASGSWVTSTIDSTESVGQHTSIAVDSNNNVHIGYFDGTNFTLKYATNASGSWVTTTIDSTGELNMASPSIISIAIDSNNKAHISYFKSYPDYNLNYATNASGFWVSTTVDSTGWTQYSEFTSIAIDSLNNVYISYYHGINGDLKYATNISDNDGDGYTSVVDCDDNDPLVNPGATEICDGIDNDCDGQVDEGLLNTYYQDADGDGYGNPLVSTQACTQPAGYVADNTDCDDNNSAVNPGAVEISYNGIDDDCNTSTSDTTPVDLYIFSLTVPSTAIAGQTIVVSDVTNNSGPGNAGVSTTKFYFSKNTRYDAKDVYLGSRAIPTLLSGTSSSGSTSVTLPSGLRAGNYYIIAIADADKVIPESNENNNNRVTLITITKP